MTIVYKEGLVIIEGGLSDLLLRFGTTRRLLFSCRAPLPLLCVFQTIWKKVKQENKTTKKTKKIKQ